MPSWFLEDAAAVPAATATPPAVGAIVETGNELLPLPLTVVGAESWELPAVDKQVAV